LPEGYFTRPKGEFNVSKFREDVARRSTYRPEGDAYRSYAPIPISHRTSGGNIIG